VKLQENRNYLWGDVIQMVGGLEMKCAKKAINDPDTSLYYLPQHQTLSYALVLCQEGMVDRLVLVCSGAATVATAGSDDGR